MNSILSALFIIFMTSCVEASAYQDAGPAKGQWTTAARQQKSPSSDCTLSVNGSDGALVLKLHGGEATATLDGEPVPQERVVRDGDHLRIQGEDGDTLFDIRLLPGGGVSYPYGASTAPFATAWTTDMTDELRAQAEEWSKPRKMIGVTTVPLDPALAAQLGTTSDEAIVVSEVFPDMPAQKAGLEVYDVVLKIDGQSPVTPDKLRDVIRGKETGQELVLSIMRAGKPLEVKVAVEEISGDRLARTWTGAATYGPAAPGAYGVGEAGGVADLYRLGYLDMKGQSEELAAAQEQLEKAHEELATQLAQLDKDLERATSDNERARVELVRQNLAAAQARVADAAASLEAEQAQAKGGAGFLSRNDGSRSLIVPLRQGGGMGGGGAGGEPSDAAGLKKMDERFAQVEERMKRLEDMLQRLVDASGKPAAATPSDEKH